MGTAGTPFAPHFMMEWERPTVLMTAVVKLSSTPPCQVPTTWLSLVTLLLYALNPHLAVLAARFRPRAQLWAHNEWKYYAMVNKIHAHSHLFWLTFLKRKSLLRHLPKQVVLLNLVLEMEGIAMEARLAAVVLYAAIQTQKGVARRQCKMVIRSYWWSWFVFELLKSMNVEVYSASLYIIAAPKLRVQRTINSNDPFDMIYIKESLLYSWNLCLPWVVEYDIITFRSQFLGWKLYLLFYLLGVFIVLVLFCNYASWLYASPPKNINISTSKYARVLSHIISDQVDTALSICSVLPFLAVHNFSSSLKPISNWVNSNLKIQANDK